MSKFKESIDKIQMNEEEKNKMLKKILNHEEEKENKAVRFVPRFATFLIAFVLLSGSCYALVKVFHVDDTLKLWFDKTDKELEEYGVGSTDVNITKEFDDASIVINQTVLDEKELYISVEITGKNESIYLDEYYLSKGTSFDETILESNISDDEVEFNGYGFGLLEESGLTNKYALNLSVYGEKEASEDVTLRLISSAGKTYDISFTLSKNDMKVQETKYNDIEIYNEGGITVTVSAIRLTPLHVIVDMKYNKDVTLLTAEEIEKVGDKVYNDNSNGTSYVTYKDGSTTELRLEYTGGTDTMLSPYGIHGTKVDQVNDIENIQSVTINNITFNIQ